MSQSSGGSTCSLRCSSVTRTPASMRFSAASRPMKPPPTTTTRSGFSSSTRRRISSASSTVRSLSTRLECHARGVRHHGLSAGREYELVVFEAVLLPAGEVFDRDALVFAVDGRDLALHAHVYVEAGPEALRGLEREATLFSGMTPPDVVGQAAVRVGHEARALEHYYLRVSRPAGAAWPPRWPLRRRRRQ